MNEVVIVTSSKDAGGGMGVVDLATGTPVCSNFKNCIAEPGSVCLTGVGYSSFSGAGACGDFIAVAQSKKPVINIYQWNKSQVLHQCHIQEITTSLASDPSGTFIFGGTKRGWIYAWEATSGALIVSWQAHFKSVTRLAVSDTGDFLISASEDGMARAWELAAVLDQSDTYGRAASASTRKNMSPYRSWNPHTLAVKDLHVRCSSATLRVLTCSADRSLVLYDVHSGRQCLRVSLPQPVESVCCNPTGDFAFLGSTQGDIYLVDLTAGAIGVSAAQAHVKFLSSSHANVTGQASVAAPSSGTGAGTQSVITLKGHSRCVTAVGCSSDNTTLVSASEDGSLRWWDVWTRQCLREVKPLNKTGISNLMITMKSELLGTGAGSHKPTLHPLQYLRKYSGGSGNHASSTGSANEAAVAGAVSSTIVPGFAGPKIVLGSVKLGAVTGVQVYTPTAAEFEYDGSYEHPGAHSKKRGKSHQDGPQPQGENKKGKFVSETDDTQSAEETKSAVQATTTVATATAAAATEDTSDDFLGFDDHANNSKKNKNKNMNIKNKSKGGGAKKNDDLNDDFVSFPIGDSESEDEVPANAPKPDKGIGSSAKASRILKKQRQQAAAEAAAAVAEAEASAKAAAAVPAAGGGSKGKKAEKGAKATAAASAAPATAANKNAKNAKRK